MTLKRLAEFRPTGTSVGCGCIFLSLAPYVFIALLYSVGLIGKKDQGLDEGFLYLSWLFITFPVAAIIQIAGILRDYRQRLKAKRQEPER